MIRPWHNHKSFGVTTFYQSILWKRSGQEQHNQNDPKTQQAINLDGKSYWIADSALYTEENIKLLGTETIRITHASATIDRIELLLNTELDMIRGNDSRYAFYSIDLNYEGIL